MAVKIADDQPRYRPAVVQTEDGKWSAMVVLFDSQAHEELLHDSAMIAWCDHSHRTEEAAKRCVPQMRRIVNRLNEVR